MSGIHEEGFLSACNFQVDRILYTVAMISSVWFILVKFHNYQWSQKQKAIHHLAGNGVVSFHMSATVQYTQTHRLDSQSPLLTGINRLTEGKTMKDRHICSHRQIRRRHRQTDRQRREWVDGPVYEKATRALS